MNITRKGFLLGTAATAATVRVCAAEDIRGGLPAWANRQIDEAVVARTRAVEGRGRGGCVHVHDRPPLLDEAYANAAYGSSIEDEKKIRKMNQARVIDLDLDRDQTSQNLLHLLSQRQTQETTGKKLVQKTR